MKTRKKICVVLLAASIMLLSLAGCSKNGNCDECGQYEPLKKYVTESGKEYWYCEDCYKLAKLFLD